MLQTEVLIVGGGPAGSACAWYLRRHHIDCLVLDREPFPRVKLCAGWIPPQVLHDLEIRPEEYPHSLTSFAAFRIAIRGIGFSLPTRQYAIRRVEFDHWLLQRSGVPVATHHVRTIERRNGAYVVDGEFSGVYLIGAGGTHCPVYRTFFRDVHPRARDTLIITQEEEFPYAVVDPHCYLWFMENQLPGYSWYVPKVGGYVNVGVGGMAETLTAHGDTIQRHWDVLVAKLEHRGLVREHPFAPKGHSYYLRQHSGAVRVDNAFIVGDAAGLATRDMGEGIGPAIKSGLLAAEAIVHGTDYSVDNIRQLSLVPRWLFKMFSR
ncbi:MAG TPA: NAD(P)/FAD-dependent oxidoreductase [Anaerolineae bacterium]|nr:NAD(P)/FAD-dependent oxidoreductase [Anaerolineae bacterium]HQH39409.1 NAD(P)/FAD-dependent oxidoreductase [Anaerolineae bacterium]